MKIKVVLDTNFFLIPYQDRIDIFQEIERLVPEAHELVTFSGVIEELRKIQEGSKIRDKVASKIALELIDKKKINILDSKYNVDSSIINLANEQKGIGNLIVCTNDKELKRILKKLGTIIIHKRGKKRLEIY